MVQISLVGNFMAGSTLTATCTVTLSHRLRENPMIVAMGRGVEIENGTVEGITTFQMSPLIRVVTFDPLHTFHGGMYMCRASVAIPLAGVSISGSSTANITVQSQSPSDIACGCHVTACAPLPSSPPSHSHHHRIPS